MPQLLSTRHRFLPSGHEDFLVLKITFSKSQGRPIHTIWLKRIPQGTYPDDTRKIPWWQPSNQKAAADISLKCISRAAPWTKYFLCWKCSSHSWPFHYPKCPSFDFSFSHDAQWVSQEKWKQKKSASGLHRQQTQSGSIPKRRAPWLSLRWALLLGTPCSFSVTLHINPGGQENGWMLVCNHSLFEAWDKGTNLPCK